MNTDEKQLKMHGNYAI